MYKIVITIVTLLILSACANFRVNSTMCDNIAREPGATIPQECRNYSEEEAEKATNKLVDEKKVSDKDIEFNQEEDK
jgi:hypothetical protein